MLKMVRTSVRCGEVRFTNSREQKENIAANVVLPGIVPTNIIPQAMLDAVKPEL